MLMIGNQTVEIILFHQQMNRRHLLRTALNGEVVVRLFHKQVVHLQMHLMTVDLIVFPSIYDEIDGIETAKPRMNHATHHIAISSKTHQRRAKQSVDMILLGEFFQVINTALIHYVRFSKCKDTIKILNLQIFE